MFFELFVGSGCFLALCWKDVGQSQQCCYCLVSLGMFFHEKQKKTKNYVCMYV